MIKGQFRLNCCELYGLTKKLIFQSTSTFCKQAFGQFCRFFLKKFKWNQILISISQVMGLAKADKDNICFWLLCNPMEMQLLFNFREICNQEFKMFSHNHSIQNENPKCKRPKKKNPQKYPNYLYDPDRPILFNLVWFRLWQKCQFTSFTLLMTIYSGFILIFILYRFFMIWLDEYEHIWCWVEQAVWLNELSGRQNAWVTSPTLSSTIKTRVHQIVMRHDMNKKWVMSSWMSQHLIKNILEVIRISSRSIRRHERTVKDNIQ